ncbi:MAG: hypothetical protein JSS35_20620 [Proteobacteria bacterium]|nr:hypothetical protein [Pseudomonadota bacterium]
MGDGIRFRPWALVGGLSAGMLAAPTLALAGPAAPPEATVSELVVTATKMVSELTVTAEAKCLSAENGVERAERPKVLASYPTRGAVVRPGLLVVRVTFDRPMACEGRFEAAAPLPNPCPGAVRAMLLSYDRRTVRTVCMVKPGQAYGFSLGDPGTNTFIGLSGLPALPARISFSTSDGPVVLDVCEALAEDAETAAQMRARGKACGAAGS